MVPGHCIFQAIRALSHRIARAGYLVYRKGIKASSITNGIGEVPKEAAMSEFKPYSNKKKSNTNWGVCGTHLVVHEPPKGTILRRLGLEKPFEPRIWSVPVAAFALDKLVFEMASLEYPNAWNWVAGALSHLKRLLQLGYLVVIFTNQPSMYVSPDAYYWQNTAFKEFYAHMERVFQSYRRHVSKCPPFMYAAPTQPSQRRGRPFSSAKEHSQTRMPATGMWLRFEQTLRTRLHEDARVDLDSSYFVGVLAADEQFARGVGLQYTRDFPEFDERGNLIFGEAQPASAESGVSRPDSTRSSSRQASPMSEAD